MLISGARCVIWRHHTRSLHFSLRRSTHGPSHEHLTHSPISPGQGAEELSRGFKAQADGRFGDALASYRSVRRARSPLLRALSYNAEGLLLLKAPLKFVSALRGVPEAAEILTEPFEVGKMVLAPYLKDGGEYGGTVAAVDHDVSQCTVKWADGGNEHTVVPLASVSTYENGICSLGLSESQTEVRAWIARRALRNAVSLWSEQGEAGTAHDAFVDLVGLLCDAAIAEARVAVISEKWLADGLGHARRHLQRARWAAERAYMPDPRALAVICMHRAELLRITAAVASGSAKADMTESLREGLTLHQRVRDHLAVSKWRATSIGGLPPAVLHEILWAKTLASLAVPKTLSKRVRRRTKLQSRHSSRRPLFRSRREQNMPSATVEGAVWTLPEKILPERQHHIDDPLLRESCPARSAVERAWRALQAVAGGDAGNVWRAGSSESRRLASTASDGEVFSKLLLEVSVIIFAMGSRLGKPHWARAVATPLATVAAQRLRGAHCADDSDMAARIAASTLAGSGSVCASATVGRDLKVNTANVERRMRAKFHWSFHSYSAMHEVWVFRSRHGYLRLPGPPPFTWCAEALALTETAPVPSKS